MPHEHTTVGEELGMTRERREERRRRRMGVWRRRGRRW